MNDYLIMKKLSNGEILTGAYGTRFKLDSSGMLVWTYRGGEKWHPVAGDGWSSLFEDEIFDEVE